MQFLRENLAEEIFFFVSSQENNFSQVISWILNDFSGRFPLFVPLKRALIEQIFPSVRSPHFPSQKQEKIVSKIKYFNIFFFISFHLCEEFFIFHILMFHLKLHFFLFSVLIFLLKNIIFFVAFL